MTTYCFVCPECGLRFETQARDNQPKCWAMSHPPQVIMRRDYGAEGVGLGSGVKVSRDGTVRDSAALFLPDNRDFAGPGDPDGNKGMREWREEHTPRDSNKKPYWPGAVDKRTF